jgi:hypothetical protein
VVKDDKHSYHQTRTKDICLMSILQVRIDEAKSRLKTVLDDSLSDATDEEIAELAYEFGIDEISLYKMLS